MSFIFFIAGMWESIGPYGGPIYTFGPAPSDDSLIYIATYSSPATILRTTDQGNSWVKRGKIEGYVFSLAVSPNNPDVLYAGGYQKIARSTDGGMSWSEIQIGGNYIYDIIINPKDPSILYAVSTQEVGLYNYIALLKSTDGGTTWRIKVVNDTNRGIGYSLALDPADPGTIYVGGGIYTTTSIPALYKSTDGGGSFFDASAGIDSGNYVYALAIHPETPETLYAGTFYGYIYRSIDGGGSWNRVYHGSLLSSLTTSPCEPDAVYAGADTIIYKSTDAGATWFEVGTGYGKFYKSYRDLFTSRNIPGVLLTCDYEGCFKSTDGGGHWAEINQGINISFIYTIGISPHDPATLYTEYNAIYKSTNNGSDWQKLPTPLDCGNLCAFAFHNSDPDIILTLEGKG